MYWKTPPTPPSAPPAMRVETRSMTDLAPDWAAVSLAKAHEILTAPGLPFEMETIDIHGRPVRVYKNAPPDLRAIFEASRQWGER
jgi:long-chain acyl-CoA synthetase